MPTRARVACIGDSCIDVYLPPVDGSFLGGNAVNTAVAVRRAGIPASYFGACGTDESGQLLLERLRARRVDITHTRVVPGPTNRCYTRPLPGGEHEFVHELNPPRLPLALSTADLQAVTRHQLLHTNWLWPQVADIPAFRLSTELLVSLDYGPSPSQEFLDRTLPFTHLAFFSLPPTGADDAPTLAERIFARGPRVVVVLLGSQGSLAFDGRLHRQPASPGKIVDTLGAGDALIGTFLAAYLKSQPVDDCLRAAAMAAARACAVRGAWPGAEIVPTSLRPEAAS